MIYYKNGKYISIEFPDIIGGKKPGLYIGEGSYFEKVGTFTSPKCAEHFLERLEYMFGSMLEKENEGGEE